MLFHFRFFSAANLNLAVEVADIADDGAVLHLAHVLDGDDVDIAGGGDENVGARRGVLHGDDLVAFHRRLQRADRIDLRDHHPAAGLAQRRGRAFADVAEARDHRHLAGHHHVGAAADAVDQRFAAAIEIVELRLGDAVVDVDGGEQQPAFLLHLIEPVHAGGGLLRDALDALGESWRTSPAFPSARCLIAANSTSSSSLFGLVDDTADRLLGLHAQMHQQGGVAAVVEDHVRACRRPPIRRCGAVYSQ